MTLLRWSPWKELDTMNRHLNRSSGEGDIVKSDDWQWTPTMDIHETDDAFVVQAELPGVDKKDVHLEVDHGFMTLSGDRHEEKNIEDGNAHHIERSFGHFMRSFSLPANVDSEHVEASMKDGVLEVRLPKKESEKSKSIAIS